MKWERLDIDKGTAVRRLRISGGWLYQVEIDGNYSSTQMADEPDYEHTGWHPPVFVPFSAVDADPGATP